MSDPRFTRSDLCSIRAATGQTEFADAVSGLLGTYSYLLAGDNPLAPWRVMPAALSSRHGSSTGGTAAPRGDHDHSPYPRGL